jgi:hypothetical protein
MQDCEGNMTCLKKWLREVHDKIVQLHEAQRISEEGYVKHSRECEVAKEEACTALANEHKKQD